MASFLARVSPAGTAISASSSNRRALLSSPTLGLRRAVKADTVVGLRVGAPRRLNSSYPTYFQAPQPKPRSIFRRILGFTTLAVVSFVAGVTANPTTGIPLVIRSIVMDMEVNGAPFSPDDDGAHGIEEHIVNHPLARQLREDPKFTESRPHLGFPNSWRQHNLTAGTLAGPDKIPVAPYLWNEEGGKSLTSMFYLGSDVVGHPGIVHGGMLATLLDEGLAWCCFPALPKGVGVTANLNINYRKPAHAGSFFVLRATTTKVEGRKAWVTGRIETLPEEGKEPVVVAEAEALFIEPKSFPTVSITNRKASN